VLPIVPDEKTDEKTDLGKNFVVRIIPPLFYGGKKGKKEKRKYFSACYKKKSVYVFCFQHSLLCFLPSIYLNSPYLT